MQFSHDIDTYIAEESQFGALLGPIYSNPITNGHISSFMIHQKLDSERRHKIIDLSWPLGASLNAGIDKTSYFGSSFDLTFPTIDDVTDELKA